MRRQERFLPSLQVVSHTDKATFRGYPDLHEREHEMFTHHPHDSCHFGPSNLACRLTSVVGSYSAILPVYNFGGEDHMRKLTENFNHHRKMQVYYSKHTIYGRPEEKVMEGIS
jgi:hypothetical protein